MPEDIKNLRSVFSDIIRGYSILDSPLFGRVIIKHLGNIDLADIDYSYSCTLQDAIKRGIPPLEKKVEILIAAGLWSQEEEEKIKEFRITLYQYISNRDTQFLKSKRELWSKQIDEINKEIEKLEIKKQLTLGDYAELFATKESNKSHILTSFRKAHDVKIPLFSLEEFDQLDNPQVQTLFDLFNKYSEKFNQTSMKKIALSSFFLNMFHLTSENIYEFYGQPVVNLTFYQVDLFSWGRHFKNLLSQFGSKLPNDILNNPDKVLEYVELNKNYEEAFPQKQEEDGGGMSLMGASKEDYEVLGIKAEGNKKFAEALKKKGKLSLEDMMALSGE